MLKQIDLPHSYYYREMFLPQLTSGPSGVAFSPDGQSLVSPADAAYFVKWMDRVIAAAEARMDYNDGQEKQGTLEYPRAAGGYLSRRHSSSIDHRRQRGLRALRHTHVMQRRIVGFHQDEEAHWVAELECGHTQHVRHNPPWFVRTWVTTSEGRQQALGTMLECRLCDERAR